MFMTGYKPMRVKKVRYYNDPTFHETGSASAGPIAYLNVPAKPQNRLAARAAQRAGVGVARTESNNPSAERRSPSGIRRGYGARRGGPGPSF
jgi:type IV secretory pathway TraG/TraD family ATPase VirD4